jgi:hypothetical protein
LLFSWSSLPGTCWAPCGRGQGSIEVDVRTSRATGPLRSSTGYRLVARGHNIMASKSYQQIFAWRRRAFDRRPQPAGHVLGAVVPASRPVRGGGRSGAERQSVCATNRAALAFFHRLVDSHNIMAAKIQGNYWMPEGGPQVSRDAAVRPPLFSFCNSPRPSTPASSGNAVLGFIRDPVRGCYCGDCQKQEKGVAGLCAQESSVVAVADPVPPMPATALVLYIY